MASVHEEVTIDAPAERVWAVVHEDFRNATKWTSNLRRVHVHGRAGEHRRLRYEIELPGWSGELETEEDVWERPRECAGHFVSGPIKGTWSYTYRERAGRTRLVYDMDFQLGGVLRLLSGVLAGQYAAGIHETMESLKAYVESGRGPGGKAPKART